MKVNGTTKILAVIGSPIEHSMSPLMQNAAIKEACINYIYIALHVKPENLKQAVDGIKAMNISGINVTIPHKEQIIQYLDEVSEKSGRIGSVNTIVNRDGFLYGDSTDGEGFIRSAQNEFGNLDNCKVLILGAGGSAKAIAYALGEKNCKITIANRNFERGKDLSDKLNGWFGECCSKAVKLDNNEIASIIGDIAVLINTTSVGMYPNVDESPIDSEIIHSNLKVYDLVYNPAETKLIKQSRTKGAKAISGLGMLIHQGAVSFEMWTGLKPPIDIMFEALRKK